MKEMLGNQYFLAGRFSEATTQFERTLLLDPKNNEVKKKLIICYIKQNELKLALKIFTSLISENIEIIINSNPTMDGCPCLQMISEIDTSHAKLKDYEKNAMLGMLWLYCDILKSREYFNNLLKNEPNNSDYKFIVNIIKQPILNNER